MKEILTSFLQVLGLAWWVEIKTEKPACTYYFGPFEDAETAKAAQAGYIEDLEQEGALGITLEVKRCKPEKLTISEDLDGSSAPESIRVFSGQMQ
jgi:hypothetical protein